MTLDEFVAEERARLDRFIADYRKQAVEHPDEWPLEMAAGEWDEQLQIFQG
jgi:hypothetical protein